MAIEIKMPQLGESVTEGTLGRWLVKPGDPVQKYQAIAEVITDKVNAEIPAPAAGTMTELLIAEGTTVKVGTPIASMTDTSTDAGGPAGGGRAAAEATPVQARVSPPAGTPAASGDGTGGGNEVGSGAGNGVGRFSPAVLKLAQEHGIDLGQVAGTGMGGRITRRDVEEFIAGRGGQNNATASPAPPVVVGATGVAARAPVLRVQAPQEIARVQATPEAARVEAALPPPAAVPGDEVIPVSPVRRRIAERMVMSKRDVPHAWTMVRADVTNLVRLRETVKDEFKKREGVDLTFMPFFIKATTDSLREYPLLNAQWAGDHIVVKREINISIAVATEDALMVPVIRNADRLSIAGLAHALSSLISRARAGKLTIDDVQSGTFTLNNTGAMGSYLSAPIINFPQAAIMTAEAISRELVVLDNDALAIRHMVNLCLSLDHRVLDGLVCLRFLRSVKQRVESYAAGTLNLY